MTTAATSASKKNLVKLAVIPALLCVLGVVVWSNQSAGLPDAASPDSLAADPAALAVQPAISASTNPGASPGPKKQNRVTWPKFTAEQILATNPFRGSPEMRAALKLPSAQDAAAVAAAAKKANTEEEEWPDEIDPWDGLREAFNGNSSAIYLESSEGPALKVGAKLLKVGDRIGDSYRVTGIRPNGITVEASPAPQ